MSLLFCSCSSWTSQLAAWWLPQLRGCNKFWSEFLPLPGLHSRARREQECPVAVELSGSFRSRKPSPGGIISLRQEARHDGTPVRSHFIWGVHTGSGIGSQDWIWESRDRQSPESSFHGPAWRQPPRSLSHRCLGRPCASHGRCWRHFASLLLFSSRHQLSPCYWR